jgi:hypothetical protein
MERGVAEEHAQLGRGDQLAGVEVAGAVELAGHPLLVGHHDVEVRPVAAHCVDGPVVEEELEDRAQGLAPALGQRLVAIAGVGRPEPGVEHGLQVGVDGGAEVAPTVDGGDQARLVVVRRTRTAVVEGLGLRPPLGHGHAELVDRQPGEQGHQFGLVVGEPLEVPQPHVAQDHVELPARHRAGHHGVAEHGERLELATLDGEPAGGRFVPRRAMPQPRRHGHRPVDLVGASGLERPHRRGQPGIEEVTDGERLDQRGGVEEGRELLDLVAQLIEHVYDPSASGHAGQPLPWIFRPRRRWVRRPSGRVRRLLSIRG